MIEKWLAPLLDKLGSKWKTVTGLALMLALHVALAAGWITAETFDIAYPAAVALFGVGIIHKTSKIG